MTLDRDIQREINRAAYLLAQKQYATYRDTLAATCKAMLAEGKSGAEVSTYLAGVAARGGQ